MSDTRIETALDAAHGAMTDAPDDDAARLRYFGVLADAALWLILEHEADGMAFAPRVFPLSDFPVVLAFDTPDRLAQVAGAAVPYAELPGRVIVQALAGQGVGIGLNTGAEAPSFLLPPDAVDWLAGMVQVAPEVGVARLVAFGPPGALPPVLAEGLAARLSQAAGLAEAAVLGIADLAGGGRRLTLALVGAAAGAEPALARMVAEAVAFSGLETGVLDVVFLPSGAAGLGAGLRLDMTPPQAAPRIAPAPPGSDPARPPRLR